MWRSVVTTVVVVGVVVAVWTYPPSRNFLLGRVENSIGVLYAKGIGVTRNGQEAVRWYRSAAKRGNAAAAFNLAFSLQQGVGVQTDEHEAAVWYERAATGGMAEAANNLGLMYANPTHGQPNFVLARIWLKRALLSADRDLAGTVRSNLQAMEQDMKPAELAASDNPSAPLPTGAAPVVPDVPATPPLPGRVVPPAQAVQAALRSARPLRDAMTRYIVGHGRLPSPEFVATADEFRAVETPDSRVSVGTGAAIDVRLRGGALDGKTFSFIPMYSAGKLQWICTKGGVPASYFAGSCK
jgi:hypothetical protein